MPFVNKHKLSEEQLNAQLRVKRTEMGGGSGVSGVKCVCFQINGLCMLKSGVTELNLSVFSPQLNCVCNPGLHLTVKSIIKIKSPADITTRYGELAIFAQQLADPFVLILL